MTKKTLLLLIAIFTLCATASAQSGMTDNQVIEYVKQSMSAGKDQKQIAMELARRGVTQEQGLRIKARIEQEQAVGGGKVQQMGSRLRQDFNFGASEAEEVTEATIGVNSGTANVQASDSVYGREIFNTKNLSFEPSSNLATPQNYRVGPGDEVIIDIWGTNQVTFRETVSPDGFISIRDLGLLALNGMTVKEATSYLRKELNKIYTGLDGENRTSEIKITLGNLRTIQVNVMGEVLRPGTYSLSSFSTMFHAIYRAGGVSDIGSLRSINLVRGGRKIATVDVYDFIMKGQTADDIRLMEGDVVIVPPYESIVKINGNVKRPMKYEMKNGENVGTLLKYAGGFAGNAYTRSVRMVRQNGKELQVFTVDDFDYAGFSLQDGDVVTAEAVIDRFENKLEIKGAVYRPGVYQLSGNINTVRMLVEKAEGLMGDAFTSRAVIHREREDLTREIISVNLGGIMAGTSPDIPLKRNDVLFIPSIFDLSDLGNVSVFGEVMNPGDFPYADNMTLEDVIIQAGGLLESASTVRVDVSRRIKDAKATDAGETIGEMYTFSLKDGFVVDGQQGFVLQPYDQVFVRRSPNYHAQTNVSVSGEILFDGTYALTKKNERVSDLIEKAGGLTRFAYAKGARLSRRINASERKRMQDVLEMAQSNEGNSNDSVDINKLDLGEVYYVGIDLEKALANPGSTADITLRAGDRLEIPELNNTVSIKGAVMFTNTVVYEDGAKLKYYIEQAGGYGFRAKKSKVYIIYANGQVKRAKRRRSIIEPGCEIVVPEKPKSTWTLQNTLSIATTSASLATMVASIANILKR